MTYFITKLHNDFKNYYKEINFEYSLGLCSSFPGLIHLKKTTMNEIWKDIEGYEGVYQVSDLGRVKSLKFCKERILKPGLTGDGYHSIALVNRIAKTATIHRLVAIHFIPNPENKPEVNHKKGIKTDNRATQLEWCTQSENSLHAFKMGLTPIMSGKDHHRSKVVMQYTKEERLIAKYDAVLIAERKTGIHNSNISMVCNGKRKTAGGGLSGNLHKMIRFTYMSVKSGTDKARNNVF